jgi:uncharacterized protein
MNATLESQAINLSHPTMDAVRSACGRIPPLWPLGRFVAVNPFLGLSGRHFLDVAALIQRVGHGEMLMSAEDYRGQIAAGNLSEQDLQAALKLAKATLPNGSGEDLPFATLAGLDQALRAAAEPVARVVTFADFLDARDQTDWAAFVTDEISKWCSVYFDEGQSSWRMPWRHLGLFAAWQAAARLDANPELMGVKGFRALVAGLPADHREVIDRALRTLGVPEACQPDFLHRQLLSLPGWSSYVQYLVRERGMAGQADDSLAQLLAIRLAYDLALRQQSGHAAGIPAAWQQQFGPGGRAGGPVPPGLLARYVAQQALECRFQNGLMAALQTAPPRPALPGQKSLQAIFCIDVRSEVFRRALEAQSGRIETIGFAGFFGMPVEYLKLGQAGGDAQCPVLLTPRFRVREALADSAGEAAWLRRMQFRQTVNSAWNAFKTSAISCFSFVETAGLWFGVKLARDTFAPAAPDAGFANHRGRSRFVPQIECETCRPGQHGHGAQTGIAPADQIALAAGALKNMGLVASFAKVVLVCGHGSATANNPYGSALDCGACGGHAGDVNARVAAAILNRPAVREGLRPQGIEIPADTVFIAGLHNTTTDEILIYEDASLSASQSDELENIKGWLSAASSQARRERAAALGLAPAAGTKLDEAIVARSRDWSQVRPEWGLAGNAAFIAAPRERTQSLNLGGRVFLHNYHAQLDPDRSTLELILTAPMVVASWINLQYYGSTVDNRLFGSGNKVLHNVVGTFGVWQGNGGDLQPGLPLQSLHDGTRWRHEPLRLSVFIEAARSDIAAILAKHPAVRELVQHGWIHLFAIEAGGRHIYRHTGADFAGE